MWRADFKRKAQAGDFPNWDSIEKFIDQVEEKIRKDEKLQLARDMEELPSNVQDFELPCGVFYDKDMNEYQKDAGCGEPVKMLEAYRCTDCAVHFHRECLEKHFEEPSIRKREEEIIAFIRGEK